VVAATADDARMVRLRRVSPDGPGFTRRRAGRGWVYSDTSGARITDHDTIDRIARLAIPPAYRGVWISPYATGHIQAVGLDDRDRKQYRYHPDWRVERDKAKHDRILFVARQLPAARRLVREHLSLRGMPRDKALATAFRLLELGFFRIGGESYAEENGSYGLATLRKEHVRVARDGSIQFRYTAKHGIRREVVVRDDGVRDAVTTLKRRHGGGAELLAWRENGRWYDVSSTDINHYLHDVVGADVSAKDFRTWHGTVLAAAALAANFQDGSSKTARRRQVVAAMKDVAEHLGNTPTVARNSYVDPRLVDRFDVGRTIGPTLAQLDPDPDFWDDDAHQRLEDAVLQLIEATDEAAQAQASAAHAQQVADRAQRVADAAARHRTEADAELEQAAERVAGEGAAQGAGQVVAAAANR